MGMAHRGRLTVLANVLGNFSERIFTSFEGTVHPNFPADEGDVKYHQGAMAEREAGGREVKLTLSPNRAWSSSTRSSRGWFAQNRTRCRSAKKARGRVLPVLIHGDAAFAGQGIVTETLNLADLKGYPHRRHDSFHHQQPDRVHHSPAAGRSSSIRPTSRR